MRNYKSSILFDCNLSNLECASNDVNRYKTYSNTKTKINPLQIVIIDDDEVDVDITYSAVRALPIMNSIEAFNDPKDALVYFETLYKFSKKPFDGLILLDQNMPTASGLDVLSDLRKTPATAEAPVYLLTNHQDDHLILEACRHYAQGFFVKPLDNLEFVTQICKMPGFGLQLTKECGETIAR